jgi:hypothetical protein
MDASHLTQAWSDSFGPTPPIGYMCRKALPQRWLRIHSLPESKRYPESSSEQSEILRRHNEVAQWVLGNDAECILFFTTYGESPRWSDHRVTTGRDAESIRFLDRLAPRYFQSVSEEGDETIQVFAVPHVWKQGSLDELILMCADDVCGDVLLANLPRGTAYAPYDGGADLFFSTSLDVVEARTEFADWLSPLPSGL